MTILASRIFKTPLSSRIWVSEHFTALANQIVLKNTFDNPNYDANENYELKHSEMQKSRVSTHRTGKTFMGLKKIVKSLEFAFK